MKKILIVAASVAALSGCAGNAVCEGQCLADKGLPVPTQRVQPQFPQLAADAQVSGCVVLTFLITPEGKADKVQIIESSPSAVFNASAQKALSEWRFQPMPDKPGRWAQRFDFRLDPTSTFELACKSAPTYDELNGKKG